MSRSGGFFYACWLVFQWKGVAGCTRGKHVYLAKIVIYAVRKLKKNKKGDEPYLILMDIYVIFKMMKKQYTFTAHIEKDPESSLYYGYIPSLPGAHTQAATLDELYTNLAEVASLCLEELTEEEYKQLASNFIGTQQVSVAV